VGVRGCGILIKILVCFVLFLNFLNLFGFERGCGGVADCSCRPHSKANRAGERVSGAEVYLKCNEQTGVRCLSFILFGSLMVSFFPIILQAIDGMVRRG